MTSAIQQRFLDQQVLYGTRFQRFIRELIVNSGVFWIFDAVVKVGSNGLFTHLTYLPQWVLLAASVVQAWIISRDKETVRWWYLFIAPALYTLIDIWVEGPAEFFSEPYHVFYWMWAGLMVLAYMLGTRYGLISLFLKSLFLVILLPVLYLFVELDNGLQIASVTALSDYWLNDAAHFFILFGSLLLGVALGITATMQKRFEELLYSLALHFEEIASWSFDEKLIQQAYKDDVALNLQRVERAVLFMDIRGFTPWSEAHTPREVVEMVNQFYRTAEPIIKSHDGFKIQMTGDEIMTRFYNATDAMGAALALQTAIADTLHPMNLSAGIGIHLGEVIEGLVGGEQTRQYGIFGDTVNTGARLQSQAKADEIVVSTDVWGQTSQLVSPERVESRELTLKGKAEPMAVMVIKAISAK